VAALTGVLAMVHHRLTRDPVAAVLGAAFLATSLLDASHAVAGDRVFRGEGNPDLLLIAWSLSRLFKGAILIAGAALCLLRGERGWERGGRGMPIVAAVFVALALSVAWFAASPGYLPQAVYPDQLIRRPYDVPALVLFALGGGIVFRLLYRKRPSLFAFALVLGAIPDTLGQIHAALGSTQLLDGHFMAAHTYKILGYLVPLAGIVLDYARTYLNEQATARHLAGAREELAGRTRELRRSYDELAHEMGERARIQESLTRRSSEFTAIIRAITDGLVFTTPDRRIALCNPATTDLFGHEVADLIGRELSFIHPSLAGLGVEEHPRELRMRDVRGEELICEIHTDLVVDPQGEAIGVAHVFRDVTRRTQAERELSQYAGRLEESNRELQQFAYVASHDLQEPLRMISSFLGLLSERLDPHLDAESREYIGYSMDGAERLRRLIQDLLQYSRVGSVERDMVPVDLTEAVAEARMNLHTAIQESGATIDHDPLPTVNANHNQLVQLFQNLLANAIKFKGDDPPRIRITAEVNAEGVPEIAVHDNGIGIESAYRERVFLIFQRLHGKREYEGTGIGLAICKKIVQRHGGNIWVEDGEGQGAVVRFTLPTSGLEAVSEEDAAA
jgi:PAS domain S-box-containing protein